MDPEGFRELVRGGIANENETKEQLVNEYLNLCKFYPVSFGSNQASSPEQGKIDALTEFLQYVKHNAGNLKELIKNGGLITKVNNSFMEREPMIGFSDDDIKNVETMEQKDYMPTFFFAETLKYFYLTFSHNQTEFNFDDYIFNPKLRSD